MAGSVVNRLFIVIKSRATPDALKYVCLFIPAGEHARDTAKFIAVHTEDLYPAAGPMPR
jgi:hypothetical protein